MRFAEIFKTELFSKYGQKAGCYINEIYDIIPCWVCDFDITKKMVTGDKEYNESAKVMVIDAVTGQVRY